MHFKMSPFWKQSSRWMELHCLTSFCTSTAWRSLLLLWRALKNGSPFKRYVKFSCPLKNKKKCCALCWLGIISDKWKRNPVQTFMRWLLKMDPKMLTFCKYRTNHLFKQLLVNIVLICYRFVNVQTGKYSGEKKYLKHCMNW